MKIRSKKEISLADYEVGVINSIKKKHKPLRSKSKAPTFAKQYGGTWNTLVNKGGFSVADAKAIDAAYDDLYKVSIKFAEKNISFGSKNGYVDCAFGLRLRTPILKQSVMNSKSTPYVAIAEGRSANNAVTQSWGLLINRAMIAASKRIEQSQFAYDVFMSNSIHDAIYGIAKFDPTVIKFINDLLVEEMEWNDHIKIKSEEVLMLADLEIGPSWDKLKELENRISVEEIKKCLETLLDH